MYDIKTIIYFFENIKTIINHLPIHIVNKTI